jgi:tetratricopeptide (TPR) repeat protein
MPLADLSVPASPPTRLDTRTLVAAAGAALASALVYLNALHNPFVYDDYHLVVDNPAIRNISNFRAIVLNDMMRPVTNFSYAIDRAVWGPAPFGFHLTSLLLHSLNVVLLFHLILRLTADAARTSGTALPRGRLWTVPFGAALLFAVHPMMTESVGYVSSRSEVLYGSFFLLAMLCGRRWMLGDGIAWALWTMGLWATALATKETSAMLPFVLFACDRLVLHGDGAARRRRLLTVHLPLLTLAGVAAIARLLVLARVEHPDSFSIHWEYGWIALDVARRYFWLLVNPRGQAAFHEVSLIPGLSDPRALIDLGLVGLLLAIVIGARRREPLASFGLVWFLLQLVPTSALIVLDRGEPMVEHRIYIASCGAFLAGAAAIGTFLEGESLARPWRRLAVAGILIAGVGSLAVQTIVRNALWASPVALWRESVNGAPGHYRPRLLLGEALQDAGRSDEALEEFRTVVRLRPQEPAGYMKLGLCLAGIGRLEEAASAFKSLLALAPDSPQALNGLGAVAVLSRQPALAREYFHQTIAADPGNVSARQSLANLGEVEETDPADVLRLCEEIQRLAPWTPGNDECIRRNRSRIAAASAAR